jgi:hypothetical protein
VIFFVNSLLKQQNTQLPSMKAIFHLKILTVYNAVILSGMIIHT